MITSFILKLTILEVSMTRAAAFIAVAALFAAPAFAGTYSAKPVAAPEATKIIGKDNRWACSSNGCTTQASTWQSD